MAKAPTITNLYLVAIICTIGGLIQGFDVSSMSAIIGTKQYKRYFHNPGSTMQGGITASMAGGSLLGALFSSWTGDQIGRRDSMFVGCAIWLVGSTLMSAVQNIAMLIVSRVVNGFAVGMLTSQGPILIAEISTPSLRGPLLLLQQWMITWGILIMYFISYGTKYIDGNASFRIPWALQMIPAIVLLACIPFLPRSPRWLASKGRWDEARHVLASLHASGSKQDPLILTEIREIKTKIELERQSKSQSWAELLRRKTIIRVHCAIFTHIWSQFSGTNAMMYYIVYIFRMAGLSGNFALIAASIQYVINVAMTLSALLFMDRWPRRQVMMIGAFVMAIWLSIEAGLLASYGNAVPDGLNGISSVTWVVDDNAASKAIIACSYLFIATYTTTWGPVGWLYPAEIIPLYIRSKTVSLATSCNFALTFFTPPGFKNIQWKVHIIFATFCLTAVIHVFLLFQETCGKTLEEVDDIFNNESIWAFKVRRDRNRFDARIEETKKEVDKVGGDVVQHEIGGNGDAAWDRT